MENEHTNLATVNPPGGGQEMSPPWPKRSLRDTSLMFGLVGFLLVPSVIVLVLNIGEEMITVADDSSVSVFETLRWWCMGLATVGLAFSIQALIVGWEDMRDMRSGKRSRNKWGRTVLGCVFGVLGMALNGVGNCVFYFIVSFAT